MGMNLLIYIEKILDKLQSILHTLAGWVVGLLLFLGDFIGGHELAVGLVVFVTLMDAVWGITVSIKKESVCSPFYFLPLANKRLTPLII